MIAENQEPDRLEGLDALRGLAALAVVFGHALHVLPQFGTRPWNGPETWLTLLIKRTPIFTLVDGHAAVLVFFVISGLVLSRQWLRPVPPPFGTYLAKRFARLYPPYIAALLLAACGQALLGASAPHGPSAWLARSWTEPLSLRAALDYILMLGNFDTLDNPVWSLDYEMRLSFLLPIMLLPLRFLGEIASLGAALALLAGGEAAALGNHAPMIILAGRMAAYGGMFLLGAAIGPRAKWLKKLPAGAASTVLGLLAWAILWLNWRESLQAIGAVLLIAAVLAPGPLARLCDTTWARFLGKISYSLYLVHLPLLMALLALTRDVLPQSVVIVALPPLAILAGWGFHAAVEAPSHRWARRIGRRGAATPR